MSATQFAKDQLKAFIERIERLEEEKKALADDIRDIYAEAKGNGYDTKALREIVKLRKQDKSEREEHEAILETYMHALGMLATTELGHAALARKQDKSEREEHEAILETYMHALGMLATTELGHAALARKQDELAKAGRKLAGEMSGEKRAAPAARPDDKVIADTIPIPVHQPVAQVGTQTGIRSALPDGPRPDGAERPHSDSMPFRPASDASAPPRQPPDLGGADDLLEIPGFLRRTADNRVPV